MDSQTVASTTMRHVLKATLAIGNFLNCGRDGGFSSLFVSKLSQTRCFDNKTTFVHYLAGQLKGGPVRLADELASVRLRTAARHAPRLPALTGQSGAELTRTGGGAVPLLGVGSGPSPRVGR
jgi:hypothetical protein